MRETIVWLYGVFMLVHESMVTLRLASLPPTSAQCIYCIYKVDIIIRTSQLRDPPVRGAGYEPTVTRWPLVLQ